MNLKGNKEIIQNCNLNFLIGSGMSAPYLRTLGNVEGLLTELEHANASAEEKTLVRASIYKSFFENALAGNLDLLKRDPAAQSLLGHYQSLLGELNRILLRRKSTILSKEINLFTTNVDVFMEHALEGLNLELNDGFNGRFDPKFSLSHFKTSRFKKSLHFDNVAELPIFNLLKLHGSLCWQLDERRQISFSSDLAAVKNAQKLLGSDLNTIPLTSDSKIGDLLTAAEGNIPNEEVLSFMAAYEELLIVNPTKEKFKHTLLNQTYYELLRIYSNELEKENTVLFVLGFSFSDEHILEITLRSLNSNPTLIVIVVAYDDKAAKELASKFPSTSTRNKNIHIIEPPLGEPNETGQRNVEFRYTLEEINKRIFSVLLPYQPSDLPANEEFPAVAKP